MRPEALCGLLAEPDRLRVYSAAILRAWHPDYASLRRYLIDEELLARDNAVYWRAGGYVEV